MSPPFFLIANGPYRQRFVLASGGFAMIDDGLGFQLVPWTPSLEKQVAARSPATTAGSIRASGATDALACEMFAAPLKGIDPYLAYAGYRLSIRAPIL